MKIIYMYMAPSTYSDAMVKEKGVSGARTRGRTK
tara:strand:- start:323 stop:424 length:102 start_codon:yes stop_codon:yes gene_type:complete